MKPANFLRYILLPAVVLVAGVKLGIEYAKGQYVANPPAGGRKFIDGEVIEREDK